MSREIKREVTRQMGDIEQRLLEQGGAKKKKDTAQPIEDAYSKSGKLSLDKETRKAINQKLMGSVILSILVALPVFFVLVKLVFENMGENDYIAFVVGIVAATLVGERVIASFSRVAAFNLMASSKSTWEAFALPLVLGQIQRMYATIHKAQSEEKSARGRAAEASDSLRRLRKEFDAYKKSTQIKDVAVLHAQVADLMSQLADSERRIRKWQRCAEYAQIALSTPETKFDKEAEVETAKAAHSPAQVVLENEALDKEQQIFDWLRSLDSDDKSVYIFGPRSRWMFRVYEEFAGIIDDVVWIESGSKKLPILKADDVVFIFSNMVFHAETDALMNTLRQVGAFYWSSGTSSFNGFVRHIASAGAVPNKS